MEEYYLKGDMKVVCVQAKSFPNDIKKAFSQLISLLPTIEGRTFFGVSYQARNRDMIYNAAVLEAFDGEAMRYGCEVYVIKKGKYLAETLKDWKKREGSIGATFKKMAEARVDTTFPCIEWYKGDDVVCMVKINSAYDD
jgi:hypothetical protein